jgi:predicted outer membrane lipoprotein
LWHQRFGNYFVQQIEFYLFNVLNALWHQRFGNCSRNRRAADHGSCQNVLNALWHQRFGNGKFKFVQHQSGRVLNALWHQRFGNSRLFWRRWGDPNLPCSTPCGIRGLATLLKLSTSPPMAVLNALWHQRFGNQVKIHSDTDFDRVLNALWHQRFGN